MMRRPDLWILMVAISCALGACGDCCMSNDPKCNPPVPEPRECVELRGGAGSSTCVDDFEPNEDEVTSAVSIEKHECENIDKTGFIADQNDVDVFRTGNCHVGLRVPILGSLDSTLEPELDVASDYKLRACIFPTCEGGETRVEGCEVAETGTDTWTSVNVTKSPAGFHGCCRFGGGKVRVVAQCPLDSGELNTFMWVDAGAYRELTCAPYMLSWNLD